MKDYKCVVTVKHPFFQPVLPEGFQLGRIEAPQGNFLRYMSHKDVGNRHSSLEQLYYVLEVQYDGVKEISPRLVCETLDEWESEP